MRLCSTSTTTDLARVARMMYDSKKMTCRPTTFTKRLIIFFEIMGEELPKDTSKNKYKPRIFINCQP